uniref:MFS domain-containing protein n=1 Tax=Caenorhabditis japonica TaxID=281687 RepID=A0A8R1IWG4_CAEJA
MVGKDHGRIICYNATYVSMTNLRSSPLWPDFFLSNKSIDDIDWNSPDLPLNDRRFAFGTTEKMLGFAMGFLGAIAAVFPMSRLTARYGVHKVMTLSGVLATVLVSITPLVIAWSFPVFVVLRVLQGITLANLFTTAGVVVNEWATINEKGLFISVLSAHVEMGAVFTMPVSGALATSAGWPWVFYLHGIILGALTILWAVYYKDRAVQHPFVRQEEWQKISYGKNIQLSNSAQPPYRKNRVVYCDLGCLVCGHRQLFWSHSSPSRTHPFTLRGVIGCTPTEAGC